MKIVVASFDTEQQLADALCTLRGASLGRLQTYTPRMIEDPEAEPSILPLVVLVAGVVGGLASFALQTYANVAGYPINIGGRPGFSWPAFIPVAFENGVLAAVVAGFLGFLIVNRLPNLYRPEDEAPLLRHASRNRWCVTIHTDRPDRAQQVLAEMTDDIEEVPA